jgi:hypothetical protein
VRADAEEIREVGVAVGELENLERAADAGKDLGEARAEPRLESAPVEVFADTDGRELRRCAAGRGLGRGRRIERGRCRRGALDSRRSA